MVGTRVEAAEPQTVFKPTLASVEHLMQFGEQHQHVVQAWRRRPRLLRSLLLWVARRIRNGPAETFSVTTRMRRSTR
ncbi:hypothetical protein [Cupriavidus gilardii]|uniref:hypothetical protein n=1 Tax=Cupriavidus gilardii TaxID=82541 RepID=UPI001C2DDABF|nr:hypothetical protein [Cupriavidus gilardii]